MVQIHKYGGLTKPTMTDIDMICEYMLTKLDALKNEVTSEENFIRRYGPDTMNYVEILLATEKLKAAHEFFNDIFKIIRHFQEPEKVTN